MQCIARQSAVGQKRDTLFNCQDPGDTIGRIW